MAEDNDIEVVQINIEENGDLDINSETTASEGENNFIANKKVWFLNKTIQIICKIWRRC